MSDPLRRRTTILRAPHRPGPMRLSRPIQHDRGESFRHVAGLSHHETPGAAHSVLARSPLDAGKAIGLPRRRTRRAFAPAGPPAHPRLPGMPLGLARPRADAQAPAQHATRTQFSDAGHRRGGQTTPARSDHVRHASPTGPPPRASADDRPTPTRPVSAALEVRSAARGGAKQVRGELSSESDS